MTSLQIFLMIAFYLALMLAVVYFTRAKRRRIAGALLGGAVFACIGIVGIALGESQGWWRIPNHDVTFFWPLLWLGLAISSAPDYLILWRIVRRFGMRGLVVSTVVVAIIGPPRDYGIAAAFPAWMTFGPGIMPVIADDVVYILLVVVGYAVMRVVSGPDADDKSARSG